MKLIAMTNKGTEYLHSKTYAFFASDRSAKKICDILNKNRWKYGTFTTTILHKTIMYTENYGVVKLKAL